MTFKWTYLFVAVVLVAAVAAFATTGGALGNSGYAMASGSSSSEAPLQKARSRPWLL